MGEAGVVTHPNTTIREVIERLGLGLSASSSTIGNPKFDNPTYRKLSSAVTKLSEILRKEQELLLNIAARRQPFDGKLEELLGLYGPLIWGKNVDRTCLLKANSTKKTYSKDLYFEDSEDMKRLKKWLRLWIIVKACHGIRNNPLEHSFIEHKTIEMEGLIRLKPQLLSPDGTPQYASPLATGRKRKISADENPCPAVKRPCHKGCEKTTPVPHQQSNNVYPPIVARTGLEPSIRLFSSNDLNGAARPGNVSPVGFTAINAPSAHSTPNVRNYSNPYGPPRSQPLVSTPFVPAINTAPVMANGFNFINSPIVSNGTPSAQNSLVIQHVLQNFKYANIASQPTPVSDPPPAAHPPPAPYPPSAPHVIAAPSFPRIIHAINGLPISSAHPICSAPPAPPAQKILKNQLSEVPLSSSDTELLRCELLGSLMQYLFPKSDAKPNEAALLRNLEYLWVLKAPFFQRQMGHLFDVQSKVLMAWVEERRKISQLRRSMENEPGVPAPDMVDRLLAMNDLRVLRLKWKTMNTQDGNQTLSPEDLLCRTFAAMMNVEGTEYLFKDGLDRLNDNMFEFLKSEDMRIMMTKR